MNKLEDLAENLLSTEMLFLGKREYQRITLEEMRNNVITRAKETYNALKSYEKGPLKAPMAHTALNSIVIRIGYGAKNESLMTFKDAQGNDTSKLRANGVTRQEQRDKALAFFREAIPLIAEGSLDEAILAKLESYQSRAESGSEKRKLTCKQRKSHSEKPDSGFIPQNTILDVAE